MSKPIRTFARIATILATVALVAVVGAQTALAAVSGNATIFNQVSVQYQSGTNVLSASANYSLTVETLATAPTVTVDTVAQSTLAGSTVTYTYTVRSNANGLDTYTVTTPVVSTANNIGAPTNTLSSASIDLWAGIVVSAGPGKIFLPGGSLSGLADNDTVELVVGGTPHRYTATIANAGSPQTASAAEVLAEVNLAPIAGAPAISAANVPAGTQVGEYTTITLDQTVGAPSAAGTDGVITTNLTFTTTATDATDTVVTYSTSSTDSNEVVTTVLSPKLNITKTADKASAKPGETITYTITVTNAHATADANAVVVTDPIPAYTNYVAGTTKLDGTPVADVSGASALEGGLNIGTVSAGQTVTIEFQVTVQ